MINVNFHDIDSVEDSRLRFAVIMAKYEEKWIYARHKERTTWEIPGGHREEAEKINSTASRELYEETGAKKFKLFPVCVYSVEKDGEESYGHLFYSEIEELGELPNTEIGEIMLSEEIPQNLTYPFIQPYLYERVLEFLEMQESWGA